MSKRIIASSSFENSSLHRLEPNRQSDLHLSLGEAWAKYCESPVRATPATVHEQLAYQKNWNEFVSFLGNPAIGLQEVTYQDANRYANFLRETKKYAVDTHNRKIKHLRKIFQALQDYLTGTNPFAYSNLLRKHREEQDLGIRRLGFTPEQEQKILQALEDSTRQVKNKPEIRIIFYLGIYTGQRLKDCVLARWNDIDLPQRRMEVRQHKTGRTVSLPIAPQLEKVLREALSWKQSDDYVCPQVAKRYNRTDNSGRSIGTNLVNLDVMRVIRWAGIQTSVKSPLRVKSVTIYGFHSLRHSFASHCAELGIPQAVVQSILGDNSQILAKYYTHIGQEAQREAINKFAGAVGMLNAEERIARALKFIDNCEASSQALKKVREILTTNVQVMLF